MAGFKRIFLFIAVNVLVMLTLSLVLSLFGVQPYLNRYGIDYQALMVFCLIWGFGGAFISLALSRIMAKWIMGVKVIDPATHDMRLRQLVDKVHRLARSAGLTTMPQVGIFESPELNAFATGPSRSRSLVAVSSGMLQQMNDAEVEGVIGHEIAHIANGDMVTMTLLQGVVNAFVMFLARILAFVISNAMRDRNDRGGAISGMAHYFLVMVLEMVFMVFGSMVVMAFSRHREFRADAGSAKIAGRNNMINALKALQQHHENRQLPEMANRGAAVQALMISGKQPKFLGLFASHPPLAERIRRLETLR